jgi:hypothetical protein
MSTTTVYPRVFVTLDLEGKKAYAIKANNGSYLHYAATLDDSRLIIVKSQDELEANL